MGTPVNPNDPAPRCPVCFGTGKPFGSAVTPRFVQLRLTRLLPGEFPELVDFGDLLITHHLQQQIDPCRYEIITSNVLWFLEWTITATLVSVRDLLSLRFAFVATVPSICELDMASDIISPTGNIAWNGFANITWDLEGL